MIKRLIKAKKDNKGLTLVEIVVTIAIVGLVAVPLLNSFIVGMRTNNVARKAEDAEQAAQNLAEAFRTTDLDLILSSNSIGSYTTNIVSGGAVDVRKYQNVTITPTSTGELTSIDSAGHWPKYEFDFNDTVAGDGNEQYHLMATLTATQSMDVPKIVDVGDAEIIQIDSAYYKYDSVYPNTSGYTKTADLTIEESYSDSDYGSYQYKYTIKLNVTYTNSSGDNEKEIYKLEDKYKKAGETLNIYLICKFFNEAQPSSDKINIRYTFTGTESQLEQDCNVFLIQQSSTEATLNPDNIQITKKGGAKYQTGTNKGFNIYSNVGTDDNPLKLTYTSKDGSVVTTTPVENATAISKSKYAAYQLDIEVYEIVNKTTGELAAKPSAKLSTTITE